MGCQYWTGSNVHEIMSAVKFSPERHNIVLQAKGDVPSQRRFKEPKDSSESLHQITCHSQVRKMRERGGSPQPLAAPREIQNPVQPSSVPPPLPDLPDEVGSAEVWLMALSWQFMDRA